jgi:hypothetical protein
MIFDSSFKNEFSKRVIDNVLKNNLEYIESVIDLAEQYEIDIKVAAKHLTKPIIEKIEKEAKEINLMSSNTTKLPF